MTYAGQRIRYIFHYELYELYSVVKGQKTCSSAGAQTLNFGILVI